MMDDLYRQWLDTSAELADGIAVYGPGAGGKSWTFGQLREAAEARNPSCGGVCLTVWEQGRDVDFLIDVLVAWREGKVLCPVEDSRTTVPTLNSQEAERLKIGHLKLTSGTTGSAKAVAFTTAQLVADCENIRKTMGLSRNSPNIAAISLAHSYGFSNLVLPLVLLGIPLVLAGSPLPGPVRSAIDESGGNGTLPAVPAMWKAWAAADVFCGANMRMAISAGAPMPLDLEQYIFNNFGKKVRNFLGTSESGGIAFDLQELPREDPGYVGEALDGVSIGVGESGRLVVESAAIGLGYLDSEGCIDSREGDLSQGRFLTGDRGTIVGGQVFLTGRCGDTINVAGRKLSPELVERSLTGDATVEHCVVFGVPSEDSGRGDEVVACLSPGEGFDLSQTKKLASGILKPWQMPRRWWIEPGLAPDLRGKISRASWRARYLETHR